MFRNIQNFRLSQNNSILTNLLTWNTKIRVTIRISKDQIQTMHRILLFIKYSHFTLNFINKILYINKIIIYYDVKWM